MKLNIIEKYNPEIIIIHNTKKVLCLIRKTYINYTKEEKIRQSFLYYLINEIKVPIERIILEQRVKSLDNSIGRIDILIVDDSGLPYIIYECKSEEEYYTDDIWKQGVRYFVSFNSVTFMGFILGEELTFYHFFVKNDQIEKVELTTHPTYNELHSGEDLEYYTDEEIKYERFQFEEPLDEGLIEKFYEVGIFGKKTDRKLLPFLFNFYNWLFDVDDKLVSSQIQDIGLKITKFGNAAGSFPAMEYRTFVIDLKDDKQFFSLALCGMKSSENVEFGTGLQVGMENSFHKHSSLQLRIETSVIINQDFFEIWHNGTITIGKIGAAKRSDLIEFIKSKSPSLIVNDKVYLGKFHREKSIHSNDDETINFLQNLFNYCLLRDEFREIKKKNSM